jgi:hypothetical protein
MYPVVPLGTLGNELVRTGFPIAMLLWVATALILGGLFLMRSSTIVRAERGSCA